MRLSFLNVSNKLRDSDYFAFLKLLCICVNYMFPGALPLETIDIQAWNYFSGKGK